MFILKISESLARKMPRDSFRYTIRSGKYYTAPQKLITREFNQFDILSVVATELERQYYGIEFTDGRIDVENNIVVLCDNT